MAAPNINDVMVAFARDAEADARTRGFVLDYSEASLKHVDKILGSIAGNGLMAPCSPGEVEEVWLWSKKYGGYVGEVVIRQMGGRWELQPLPEGGARIVLRCCGVQAFPHERIYQRLTADRFSAMVGYCRGLRAMIENREKKP